MESESGERFFQVVRFDLEGNQVGIYERCLGEQHAERTVNTYNLLGGNYRLRRRQIDLSKLPSNALGEFV